MDCNDYNSVFTEEINEWISRYNLLKNYGISSYGNVYENMPAKWIDILQTIDSNITKSIRAYRDYKKS